MSQWNYLKRDCPICNGDRKHKDCRQSLTTNLVFCHDDQANPIGWKFRGHDRNGFGIWQSEEDASAFTEQSQAERERERAAKQAQKQARRDAQIAAQLPAVERDKWNRKLIQPLSLSAIDHVHLLDRGFLPEWIEADGYCTVEQWQALPFGFPLNFPGRSQNGKLVVKGVGILCLIRDVNGQIVGFQVRHRDGSIGRYHWVSCQNSPVHLNGEMPIGVYVPIEELQGDAVWLCDSPAIKASLARYRLNAPVIGATNGSFASSPETTQDALTKLFDRHTNLKRLVLAPDAGDVKNKAVMQRWRSQHKFLTKLGYQVQFAWWGQISKDDDCDIDELAPAKFDQIRYLSLEEFEAIAIEQGGIVLKTEVEGEYTERVKQAQKYLNTLYLTPDLELDCEFLPPELWQKLPLTGIVNLLSRKGSGKSKAMLKPAIASFVEQGKRVISVTPRVVLGLEQCEKFSGLNFKMRWIDTLGSTQEAQSQQPAGSCCWDSFWKIANQHWDVLILDEVRLGIKHLATSNTAVKERRPQILKMLAELVRRVIASGGLVILCDADLTNVEVDYIRKLAPATAKTFTIVNRHMGLPRPVDFYTGKREGVEQLIYEHLEEMFLLGLERPIIITADNQKELKAIAGRLLKHFPQLEGRIVRIDSSTTEEEAGKAFVQHINSEIERLRPLVLLYSPSMEVGVSIEVEWFTRIFSFYFGVIEPCEFRQLIARERHNLPLTIWATDRNDNYMGSCRSPLPDVVKRTIAQNIKGGGTPNVLDLAFELAKEEADGDMDVFRQIFDALWQEGNWNNAHLDLAAQIQARANFAKPQCAVQLRQELIEMENCQIRDWGGTDSWFGREIQEQKEQDARERAAQLSAGAHSDMTVEEAREIGRNPNATIAQRIQAEGVLLQDYLPGVSLTPDFVFDRKVGDPRWLNAQRLFWLIQHPEVARMQDAKKWKSSLYKWQHGDVYLPDLHLRLEQVEFMRDSGLLKLLDESEYHTDHVQVKALMEFMQQRKWKLQRLFELNVSEATDPISFVGRLLSRLGLNQAKLRGDGETRFYRVKGLGCRDRLAVMLAWDQKYADLIDFQPAGECCLLSERDELTAQAEVSIADRGVVSAPAPVASVAPEPALSAPTGCVSAIEVQSAIEPLPAPVAAIAPLEAPQLSTQGSSAPAIAATATEPEILADAEFLPPDRLAKAVKVMQSIDSLQAVANFFTRFRRCTEAQQQQIKAQFPLLEPTVRQRFYRWWQKFEQVGFSICSAPVEAVIVPAEVPKPKQAPTLEDAVAAIWKCYTASDYKKLMQQFTADLLQAAIDQLKPGTRNYIEGLRRCALEFG